MAEFSFDANPAINPAVIGQLATWAWVTDKAQFAGSLHRGHTLAGPVAGWQRPGHDDERRDRLARQPSSGQAQPVRQ